MGLAVGICPLSCVPVEVSVYFRLGGRHLGSTTSSFPDGTYKHCSTSENVCITCTKQGYCEAASRINWLINIHSYMWQRPCILLRRRLASLWTSSMMMMTMIIEIVFSLFYIYIHENEIVLETFSWYSKLNFDVNMIKIDAVLLDIFNFEFGGITPKWNACL